MAKRPAKKKISKVSTLLETPEVADKVKEAKEQLKTAISHTIIDYNKIADDYKKAMQSKTGRPKKPEAANRVKLTTKLHAELIKFLKVTAIQNGITTADFIEELIIAYIQANNIDYPFNSEIMERLKNR